jgi:YD repeat-containing protein
MIRFTGLACVLLVFLASLKAQEIQSDSTKNGVFYLYGDSGHIRLKAYYKDTLRVKTWTEYDSQGFITKKTRYRKGKIRWIHTYDKGLLTEVTDRKGAVRKRKKCGC